MSYYWFNKQELLKKAKQKMIIMAVKKKLLNIIEIMKCFKRKGKK